MGRRSNPGIHRAGAGLLRYARNDEAVSVLPDLKDELAPEVTPLAQPMSVGRLR